MFAEESPEWSLDLGGTVTCESCNEEPATVHLLRVVNGAITHTHLCARCAELVAQQTDGIAVVLAVPSSLWGLRDEKRQEERESSTEQEAAPHLCQVCGTTLSDLKESGLAGCSCCYQAFAPYIETLLGASDEKREHLGKIPRCGPEADTLRHEMMRLERMLKELVACERFEEAASVRDRLVELGKRLEAKED